MSPDRLTPLPFLDSINSLWGLIAGLFFGLWTSIKVIWNISRYFRGIDDRFDKLEDNIADLRQLIVDGRQHGSFCPPREVKSDRCNAA